MSATEIRELRNAPAMLPLFAKAVIRAGVKPGKDPVLPAKGIRLSDIVLDPKHLATYRKVCGFQADGYLPVTYPHLHAHPLFMSLLLDKSFPFAAMGLVHVRNRITQYRRIQEREQLDVECRFGELRRVAKGYEFSILTHISTGGELVWESESIMFRRGGGTGEDKGGKKPAQAAPVTDATEWKVSGDMGRRYGAVSGDRNPIHLYPLTAKLFGFKRQIVHGMWSKARCLAEVSDQLPEGFSVDVQFKLPMFIPAKVKFAQEKQADGLDFRLLAADGIKPHLSGEIRKL